VGELMARSSEVVGTRPGSAVQDLVLSIELGYFFFAWLREWPRIAPRSRPFFVMFAVSLLGAALWCGLGVYIHLFEPLPTERTTAWLAFLGLGAVTPSVFPLVSALAFAKEAPTFSNFAVPYAVAGLAALGYCLALTTGVEVSLGGMLPKELWLTPWHAADGRSYGGEKHGISFDLLSSFPCYRGDSMFLLSTFFLLANAAAAVILQRATHRCEGAFRDVARRLCIGVTIMLVNCASILYLLVVCGMSVDRVFDVFHAIQGLVMAASFFDFRSVLRMQMQDQKSA